MKRVTKLKITIIAITTIALGSVFTVYAANELQSHGRFEYKSDPSPTTADVVLDSEDLNTIYTEVKDGKTALATSINTATGTNTVSTNVNSLPTFEQLSNAIDHVKQAGVDEAYHQIATSPNLDSGTYGSVTDLASLESAITQDNNNYREQIIEEIKNDPEGYGISTGFKALKIASGSAGTSINLIPILANAGEDPYLYQSLTVDNFYYRISSSAGTVYEGHEVYAPTMSYDTTTGVFTFNTGIGPRWISSHSDYVHSIPYVDVYLIY